MFVTFVRKKIHNNILEYNNIYDVLNKKLGLEFTWENYEQLYRTLSLDIYKKGKLY